MQSLSVPPDAAFLSTTMAHSPKPITKYNILRGDTGTAFPIRIHAPKLRSENLSLTTWGSSYILANALREIPIHKGAFSEDGLDILELGAGTGLVGLSASVIWKGDAVLTDLPGIVLGLALNIDANHEILTAAGTKVTCGSLDWNRPSQLELHNTERRDSNMDSDSSKASIVLAADTIYDSDHPEMLVKTIFSWLRLGEHARVIVAYPLRVAYLDAIREMWERLEAGGLTSIQEGRADAGDEFEDENMIEWAVFKWKQS